MEQKTKELRYHAEEVQLSDKEETDRMQQPLMSTSNSSTSSSSILVLKENIAVAKKENSPVANPDPTPVASLLLEKDQLGPSSGLSPGLCRGANCGISAGQALEPMTALIILACSSIIPTKFLI